METLPTETTKELITNLRSVDIQLRVNQGRDTEIAIGELCHDAADFIEQFASSPILEQKEVFYLQTILISLRRIQEDGRVNQVDLNQFLEEIENFI